MAKININITLSKDERKIVLQMVGLSKGEACKIVSLYDKKTAGAKAL